MQDKNFNILGYYDSKNDLTKDRQFNIVGHGDTLTSLLKQRNISEYYLWFIVETYFWNASLNPEVLGRMYIVSPSKVNCEMIFLT